jgi:hypothetical protein
MQTQPCICREMMIMVMKKVMEVTIEMKKEEEMMIEAAGELLEMIVQAVVEIIGTVEEIEMVGEIEMAEETVDMEEGVVVEVIIETEVVIEIEIMVKKRKTIQDCSSEDLQEMKLKIKQEKRLVNLEKLKM